MAENSSGKRANGSGPGPEDSVVARAVELGYKVIEEQIRQGQQIAEEMTRGNISAGMVNGNASEVGERVLRFYSDMGALWFETLESVFRNPSMGEWFTNFMADPGGALNGFAKNGAGPAGPGDHSRVPVEIVSSEPTGARVTVDLRSDCPFDMLLAEALRTRGDSQPPLREISFTPAEDDWPAAIRITIPAGQPPGTYSGLILNTLSDEPAGTLCVHIPAKEPEQQDS